MADLRIPSANLPAVARPQPTAKIETLQAAQRAFFQAAMETPPPAATPTPAPPKTDTPTQPQRMLRPGSLIDIKV